MNRRSLLKGVLGGIAALFLPKSKKSDGKFVGQKADLKMYDEVSLWNGSGQAIDLTEEELIEMTREWDGPVIAKELLRHMESWTKDHPNGPNMIGIYDPQGNFIKNPALADEYIEEVFECKDDNMAYGYADGPDIDIEVLSLDDDFTSGVGNDWILK